MARMAHGFDEGSLRSGWRRDIVFPATVGPPEELLQLATGYCNHLMQAGGSAECQEVEGKGSQRVPLAKVLEPLQFEIHPGLLGSSIRQETGGWGPWDVLRSSSWPSLDIRSVPSFHVRDHRRSEWLATTDYRVPPSERTPHQDAWSRNE